MTHTFTAGQPDVGAYFSDRYVAWMFGVSREQVQRRCHAKQWPHFRVGKSYRFKAEHITAIEALCEVKPEPQTNAQLWGVKGRAS